MSTTETKSDGRKAVYTIIERDGQKSRWTRIGVAFLNKDGSYNIVLDAVPVNGKLHIRDFPPRDGGKAGDASDDIPF